MSEAVQLASLGISKSELNDIVILSHIFKESEGIMDNKDTINIKKRLSELADKSYRQNIYTFSQFLGLGEQSAFHEIRNEVSFAHPEMSGGIDRAERVVIRFGSPKLMGYEEEYPIKCVHVTPLAPKFADKLTHRDFLGALMNLGIERNVLGDILVSESEAYIMVLESMSQYIIDNLGTIKHTSVRCEISKPGEVKLCEPKELEILVSSMRIDAIISKVYNMSREKSLDLFRAQKVFVNGKLAYNNSLSVKGGETVSVRGFGRFVVSEETHTTKKGRILVRIGQYV